MWDNSGEGIDFLLGGDVVTAPPRPIRRTLDDTLYLTRREGEFRYNIPVPPGTYELRLHFAETVFGEENVAGGGESSRVFNVQVNAGDIWTADVVSEASGPNTATIRIYRGVQPGTDPSTRRVFCPTWSPCIWVHSTQSTSSGSTPMAARRSRYGCFFMW